MSFIINPYRFAGSGASYEDEVLADSPQGYWRLDEASGNAIDIGSLAHDLTVTGSPTRSVSPGAVSDGTAYTFAGSQYLTGPQDTAYGLQNGVPAQNNTDTVTLECWAKWTSTTLQCIAGYRYTGTNEEMLIVFTGWNSGPGNLVIYQTGAMRCAAGGPYNDGNWHHIVARTQAAALGGATEGTLTLWVDGTQVATANADWPNLPASGYRVEVAHNNGIHTFVGSVDEVAIYGNLSDARIAAHHAAA